MKELLSLQTQLPLIHVLPFPFHLLHEFKRFFRLNHVHKNDSHTLYFQAVGRSEASFLEIKMQISCKDCGSSELFFSIDHKIYYTRLDKYIKKIICKFTHLKRNSFISLEKAHLKSLPLRGRLFLQKAPDHEWAPNR